MVHKHAIPVNQVLLVSLAFLLASMASHQFGLDLWLARHEVLMEGGGQGFSWRDNFWLKDVIHEGGRWLVKRMLVIAQVLLIASFFIDKLKPYRWAFSFIVLSAMLSTGIISGLKHSTTIPCPQSLIEFGGDRQWVNIWQMFSADLPQGKCYPAGHSSGGYAWLCLAFVFPYLSRTFYLALIPGVLLGLSFGLAQQFRGAHFLSHDLLTVSLSWLVPGVLYHLMYTVRWKTTLFSQTVPSYRQD